MTLADAYAAIESAGLLSAGIMIAVPVTVGIIALLLQVAGRVPLSQALCNLGIALALATLAVEILVLIYAVRRSIDLIFQVDLALLLAPSLMVAVAFAVEHFLHRGKQVHIRRQLRSGMLVLLVVAVGYYVLSTLDMHMLIWTNVGGFLVFVLLIIAVLYAVVRKVL